MAQYIINDPEDLLVCPYDAVHLVRAKRFQYHLMKCRRNYLGHDFAVCPFNACHEMPRPELRYHIANCSDKALVEQEVVHNQMRNLEEEGTYFKGDTSVPPYHHDNILLSPTEDWDTELPKYPSFRGNYDLFKDGDLELPCGMTLEERESLQEKIRQEFDRRIKGLEGDTSESDTDYSAPELRLPHRQPIAVKQSDRLSLAGVGRGGPTPGSLGMPPANKVRSGRLVNTPLKMLKGKLVEAQYLREQAALLQSLSRGRGIGRGTSLESVVGSALPTMVPASPLGLGRGSPVTHSPRGLQAKKKTGSQPRFVIPKVDFSVSGESSSYVDSEVDSQTETETETEIETDLETETTLEPLSCSSTDVETETELELSETETEKGDDEDLLSPLIEDHPPPLIENHPSALIEDRPPALIEDRPPALIKDRPPALIKDRLPALIEDRPPALIEDRPPALIKDCPPALIEDRPPALIKDRPPVLIEDLPPPLIGEDEDEETENGRKED